MSDTDMWVKRHKSKGHDVAACKLNVRELLNCQSVAELTTKLLCPPLGQLGLRYIRCTTDLRVASPHL